MVKKLRLAIVILAFGSLLSLLGCNNASNTKTIGVSLLTMENPFFRVIGDSITAEAKKHGYETIVLSADQDAPKQSNQVKDFIAKKVVAIVISPKESRSIVPAIQEANAAGIPVFTVDIPCHEEGVKIECQIATDNYGGGKLAGEAMIEALGETGGEVAILDYKTAESCRLRVKGFTEVIEKHKADGKKGKINIVATLEGNGDRPTSTDATRVLLESHAEVRGIFAVNDPSALGCRAALEKAGKADQVKIIGFDGQPDGKRAIKEGKIYADPIQYPDRMGVEIVQAFLRYSQGEKLKPEILIPTTLYRKADGEKDPALK